MIWNILSVIRDFTSFRRSVSSSASPGEYGTSADYPIKGSNAYKAHKRDMLRIRYALSESLNNRLVRAES